MSARRLSATMDSMLSSFAIATTIARDAMRRQFRPARSRAKFL